MNNKFIVPYLMFVAIVEPPPLSMHESSRDILWIASWGGQTIYDRVRLTYKGAGLIGPELMLADGRGTQVTRGSRA